MLGFNRTTRPAIIATTSFLLLSTAASADIFQWKETGAGWGGSFGQRAHWNKIAGAGGGTTPGAADDALFSTNGVAQFTAKMNHNDVNHFRVEDKTDLILDLNQSWTLKSTDAFGGRNLPSFYVCGAAPTLFVRKGPGGQAPFTLTSEHSAFGIRGNQKGTVTFDDLRVRWQNNRSLIVGGAGTGILNLLNGVQVTVDGQIMAGRANTGSGTIELRGQRNKVSTLTAKDDVIIGEEGTGVMNIYEYSTVNILKNLIIGKEGRRSGEVIVGSSDGPNANLAVTEKIIVGDSAKGTMHVKFEAEATCKDAIIGKSAEGRVLVGLNGRWVIANSLLVGAAEGTKNGTLSLVRIGDTSPTVVAKSITAEKTGIIEGTGYLNKHNGEALVVDQKKGSKVDVKRPGGTGPGSDLTGFISVDGSYRQEHRAQLLLDLGHDDGGNIGADLLAMSDDAYVDGTLRLGLLDSLQGFDWSGMLGSEFTLLTARDVFGEFDYNPLWVPAGGDRYRFNLRYDHDFNGDGQDRVVAYLEVPAPGPGALLATGMLISGRRRRVEGDNAQA